MKKIIMGIAAVAMAASMFAADVAAQVKGSVNLFTITDGGKADMLIKGDLAGSGDTKFVLSVSGDKAGGTFRTRGAETQFDDCNVWFAPTDAVKVMIGTGGPGFNQEHFTWWQYNVGMGKVGGDINVEIKPVDGLAITLGFGDYWMKAGDIGKTVAKVGYSADFGTVFGIFAGNSNFKDLTVGAGYSNSFGAVGLFTDVAANLNDGLKELAADVDVTFAQDAFSADLYVKYDMTKAGDKNTNAVTVLAKGSYALDGATVYVDFRAPNVLAEKFAATIEAGANYNIGIASMNTAVKYDVAAKKVDVPLSATISF